MTTIVREEKPVNVLNVATALASGALSSDQIVEMFGNLDASDFDTGVACTLEDRQLPFDTTINRVPVDVIGLIECVEKGKVGLDGLCDTVRNLSAEDLNTAIAHLLDPSTNDEEEGAEHDECCA